MKFSFRDIGEGICVQMVVQLGRFLELIGWLQAVIVVIATTSLIPDFMLDIIYSPVSPHSPPAVLRLDLVASVHTSSGSPLSR